MLLHDHDIKSKCCLHKTNLPPGTRPHPDVDFPRFAAARPDKQMVGQLAPPAERTSAVAPRDALSQLDVGLSPYILGLKRSREPRYPFRFRAPFGTLYMARYAARAAPNTSLQAMGVHVQHTHCE